jgi:hypothetical protein
MGLKPGTSGMETLATSFLDDRLTGVRVGRFLFYRVISERLGIWIRLSCLMCINNARI